LIENKGFSEMTTLLESQASSPPGHATNKLVDLLECCTSLTWEEFSGTE
jgi:hypothetical protein